VAYFYGNCIIGALYSEFELHCLLPLPTPATMATGSTNGVPSQESTEKSQAVTFTVDFEEKPKNSRRIPKNLTSARTRKGKKVSEETIAEKQKLAEERRKVKYIYIYKEVLRPSFVFRCLYPETYRRPFRKNTSNGRGSAKISWSYGTYVEV